MSFYNNIRAVEWSRPEMQSEYVLFYRDGRLDPYNQHPSYKNRVDLQDKEMKDGDFSLILRNVTMEDNGTYECRVFEKGKIDPISNIILEVHLSGDKSGIIGDGEDKDGGNKDGGNKDGGDRNGGDKDGGDKVGIIVGAAVGVILLLAVALVAFLICRRHTRKNPDLPVPPDDEAAAEQML
ncbi:putative butyrophilin subfamily 2 member A3 [Amphiprion ocellaris]|uniref:putative butyrophilin subfamily 2 member A3 n=1 Tax=Amphiprion ocellaris TaxID=80972 RepID=UPI002410F1BD|nr:putative butyrophilin subfamily 2 member A3 [Amphiprion ocellaris]XP_054863399.1 putative butyrophilin subfamily 2 member A3 [Amphiprion ocellaris]